MMTNLSNHIPTFINTDMKNVNIIFLLLPSSWSTYYSPTIWEIGFYLGTFGLFFTCYFLFAKFFPVIAVAEIKAILKTSGENYKAKMTDTEKMDADKFYIEEVEHAAH